MTYDIIGIGEALIEFAEVGPGSYVQSFAGDIINSLYYARMLGRGTSFFSTIGSDAFSKDLIAFLDRVDVDHSLVRRSSKNNGLYVIRTDANGEPSYTFFRDDSAARTTIDDSSDSEFDAIASTARVVMTSSIALGSFHARTRFVELLRGLPTTQVLYVDTNVRRAQWGDFSELRDLLTRLAPRVNVLSTSLHDDEALFGVRDPEDVLHWYRSVGAKNIILRRGSEPVELLFDDICLSVPVPPVTSVVDATGAGDAFNAGFVNAMLNACSPLDCAEQGIRCAAQVLGARGGIVASFDPNAVIPKP